MQIVMDGRYCKGLKTLELGRYPNGGLAIKVVGDCALSVNPVREVPAGCICIKNWGECEGIEESLILRGLIGAEPEQFFQQGFVSIPVYRLMGKLAELSHDASRLGRSVESALDELFPNTAVVDLG